MMEAINDRVTQGTLRSTDGRTLPLQRTDVEALLTGPVADVVVRQRFRNDSATAIEAVYLFPLPHDAAVYRMEFRIADRVVRGVVKEKAEARRDYERARGEGRAATLLEEDKPALFTLSVANVAPGATLDVELAYQEVIAYDDGRWRFAFPMVAPEHYREGVAPSTREALAPPRVPSGERANDVSIEVSVRDTVDDLACSSHPVDVVSEGAASRVKLRSGASLGNRDFVLTWRAGAAGVRPLVRFERKPGEAGTFLLVVTPSIPKDTTERVGAHDELKAVRCGNCGGVVSDLSSIREIPGLGPVVPCAFCGALLAPGTETYARATRARDVLILLDRSASMRHAVTLARQAVETLLANLGADDAVQLVAFDHDRVALDGVGTRYLPMSPELIAQAGRFLSGVAPRGGTELDEMFAHLASMPVRSERTRVVVLITDAAVGNEGRLLRQLTTQLNGARLFVLGVGPAVDRRLVARLAQVGGGAHDIVDAGSDATATLARFARRVREGGPVLTNLTLWWEAAGLAGVDPQPLPDLYGGEPVRVLGRFSGTGPSRLVLTATTSGGRAFRQELAVELPSTSQQVPGLARLWARRRVTALTAQAESDPAHAREVRAEALSLSLTHAIVSAYTALVAEDLHVSVAKRRVRKGRLVVERGEFAGRAVLLEGERVVIGRIAGCQLTLQDASVSRHHAEVTNEDDGFVVRDLDSVNGTSVNGARVREARLEVGDLVAMGGVTLRYEHVTGEGSDAFFEVAPSTRVVVPSRSVDAETSYAVQGEVMAPLDDAEGASRGEAADGFFASKSVMRASTGSRPAPAAPHKRASVAAPGGAPLPPAQAAREHEATSMHLRSIGETSMAAPMPRSAGPMPMSAAHGSPPLPPSPGAPLRRAPPAAYGRSQTTSSRVPQSPLEVPGSEPYPEHELQWLQPRLRGELDLVFLVDETGSMGSYIDEVRTRLVELVDALRASTLCRSLRLGVVSYRDHPPQDATYASHVVPLTSEIDKVRIAVQSLSAEGGGDGPESVTDGLYDLVRLDWRASAVKAVVWFGDAPPHGVEPQGDAFPQGCPCGHHWYAQAENCREMGITIYAIGCLPGLRSFVAAEGVFRTVARATRGSFLPLREAGLLVPLIAGAAVSELDRERIDLYVEELLRAWGPSLAQTDEAERVRWITEAFARNNLRARSMIVDESQGIAGPQRFRAVTHDDIAGSLHRLRTVGRVAV
jgi:Ca-activated chloride channel family protein